MLPQVVILAGGLGTRLGEATRTVPKALVEVAGEPFLIHQLSLLARHGAKDVVLCVGYLGVQIEEIVGSRHYGLRITYSYDGPGLDGTLGAIRRASPLLDDPFLLLYGDTYLQIDYEDFANSWQQSGLPAAMAVLRNENRWGTSNACYESGRVFAYDKRTPSSAMNYIDYGLGGLTKEALGYAKPEERDLADLSSRLALGGLLFGYEATDRFYEIGTPEALRETEEMFRNLR